MSFCNIATCFILQMFIYFKYLHLLSKIVVKKFLGLINIL